MAAFLDICRFLPTAGGTTDWTFAAVVQGYQSPMAAGASNGRLYKYRAETADLTQWEVGEGAYNASTSTFARTTVLFNSAGTTSKVNFSAAPQVAIVALKEDLIAIEEANSFTVAQQAQARTNIGAAAVLRTRRVIASGAGTYSTPVGCNAINVRMVGGGSGGGGGNGGQGGGGGSGTGGTTAFGTSLLVATGGNGAGVGGSAGNTGGLASGGDINVQGGAGAPSPGAGGTATGLGQGGMGGSSCFGGAGYAGWNGGGGQQAAVNSGSGGGGGGSNQSGGGGSGGAAGGYCEKLISSPAASYSFQVGAGSVGGLGGASGGFPGGNGGNGMIIIDEYY